MARIGCFYNGETSFDEAGSPLHGRFMKTEFVSTDVKILSWIMFLFICMFRLPNLFNPEWNLLSSLFIGGSLLFVVVIITMRQNYQLGRVSSFRLLIFGVFLLIEGLAYFQAFARGTLSLAGVLKPAGLMLSVAIFTLFSMSQMKGRAEINFFLRFFLLGWFLFALTNLLFYSLSIGVFDTGIQYAQQKSLNILLSVLGLDFESATFALENGPKSIASILVFLFSSSLIWLKFGVYRLTAISMLSVSFLMIVLSDSRAGLLLLLLLIVFSSLILRFFNKRIMFLFIFLLPLFPIALIVIASYLGSLPGVQVLSRSQNDNIATLSSRQMIWQEIGGEIEALKPNLLYGYGLAGMKPSGINAKVSYIFDGGGWSNTGIKSAHNTILQTLLDKGVLGVLAYLSLTLSMLLAFFSRYTVESFSINFGFFCMLVFSNIDAVFYFGRVESYLVFITLACIHCSSYFSYTSVASKRHSGVGIGSMLSTKDREAK